jgi:lysine-arginine-ornithine-binding protein
MWLRFRRRGAGACSLAVVVLVGAMGGIACVASAQTPAPAPKAKAGPAPKTKPGQKPPEPPLPKVTVVTEGNFPPFNMRDAQGKPAGFEIDLVNAICQRAKLDCRIATAKWDDIIPGLLDKRFDIAIASLQITQERRRYIAFSRRYYTAPAAFVTAKGALPADGAPALLRGKTVGVQRGTTFADYLERAFRKTIKLRQFPTADDARRELAAGKLDAVLGDKVALWGWLKSADGACCAFFGEDVKDQRTLGEGIGAGFRKDEVKLRESFNRALAEILADGAYRKLSERYFPFPVY